MTQQRGRPQSVSSRLTRVPAVVAFAALLVLALLAFACNEASEPSPDTSDGAPTPVIGIYDDPQDFRSFAVRL